MTTELLETIDSPADLKRLDRRALKKLADELRAFILASVSRTGGHLSSNLGTVELTLALHYVFDTPHDRLVWDVGHQSYPHKILTGRREGMAHLRQAGGISGFPRRCESEYDAFGTAHSSTSISAALGMAVASRNAGVPRQHIAVIGDGAMSAGMAFEAMNNAGVTLGHQSAGNPERQRHVDLAAGRGVESLPGPADVGTFLRGRQERRQGRAAARCRRCSNWPGASRNMPRAW